MFLKSLAMKITSDAPQRFIVTTDISNSDNENPSNSTINGGNSLSDRKNIISSTDMIPKTCYDLNAIRDDASVDKCMQEAFLDFDFECGITTFDDLIH